MSVSLSQTELDRIAEEFSAAIRRGEQPSLELFLTKYPDASGQLRELLSSVAMIEGLKQETIDPDSSNESMNIDQLDDYTIVREIGRGGMGVVFEAIHQSLGRRVAVKVLASRLIGESKHLARFRREARAAARLRHSNIVPVFGVGQAGEHHYYVMDLIDGLSLKEWSSKISGIASRDLPTIDETYADSNTDISVSSNTQTTISSSSELAGQTEDVSSLATNSPQYFRWIAKLGFSIADALQYAHSKGVLHRDIKPANLLVDKKNEVWIADFGLAKLSEQQAVTMTGDVVGTPQYMPPESFDGTYDEKSEVYGVGLTLFEMLALRPAIDGKNTGDTIRKATEGVTSSPRKYNTAIPADLETIVMKALAHDPRRRYLSAGDLRDDIERYLTDRPISARRTGPIERLVRWSRREPKVATLTFAAFSLLSALVMVSAIGFFRTKDALEVAKAATRSSDQALELKTEALITADAQRARAEKNLQVALTAFDRVMTHVSERGIEADSELLGEVTDTTSANVTPEDAQLLQSLLGFFDELAANNSEDLLAESAVAAQRAGDIYVSLGKLEQADRAYTDALDRYSQLAAQEQNDSRYGIAQAEIMNQLAVLTSIRGELYRADKLFYSTTQLLEEDAAFKATPEGKFQYAKSHRLYAARGSLSGLDGMNPTRTANVRQRRPIGKLVKRRTDLERDAIQTAMKTLEELIREFPDEIRYQAELARVYRDLAKLESRSKQKIDANEAAREAIDRFERLLARDKDSEVLRYELATTLLSIESFGFNKMTRAIRADQLTNQLLSKSPTQPRYQALNARSHENIATLEARAGDLQQAEKNFIEAARIYSELIKNSPELSHYETKRSQALESVADLKIRDGNPAAAIIFLQQALRQLQPRLRDEGVSPVTRLQIQRMRQKLNQLQDSTTTP